MDVFIGIWVVFRLILPGSSFCGHQDQGPSSDKAEQPLPEQAEALEVPWLLNIYGNGKNCRGVVLSSWWGLTAAKCFMQMIPSHVEVTGSRGEMSIVTVSQFIPHKGFSSWNKAANNDLGLVLLGQPLDFQKEYLWPACIPKHRTSYITQKECKILERSEQGSTQTIQVDGLEASECAVHWPGTTEDGNLCVARRISDGTDCVVSVGSPVVCHNLSNGHWEVTAIVTQTLQNCTAPLLATQVSSHLEWLKKQGVIELEDNTDEQSSLSEGELSTATGRELSSQPEQTVTSPSRLLLKPTLRAYLVRHITARHSTLGPSSRVTKPSSTANNVIVIASPTVQKLLDVMPTRRQSVPQTTQPLTTIGQSSVTSPTTITSTTTQQSSTKQQSSSEASSTTTQTTVKMTRRPSPQASPTFREPHIIILPATTPRTSSATPATDINQGIPVRFVYASPQFPENIQEESLSSGPSPGLRALHSI